MISKTYERFLEKQLHMYLHAPSSFTPCLLLSSRLLSSKPMPRVDVERGGLHRTLEGRETSKGQASSGVRSADRGPSSLVRPSVVLAAVEGDVQGLVHALRDVLLLMVARQVMEQRVPGGRRMVALEGEVHLGLLRSLPRRQAVAAVDRARADSGRRAASALDPIGRLVARYRVSAKRATAPHQTNSIVWC